MTDFALSRLAKVVRERREARGWSQQTLAEAIGTSRHAIKRIESGTQDARASVVLRTLRVLGCSSSDVLRVLYGAKSS